MRAPARRSSSAGRNSLLDSLSGLVARLLRFDRPAEQIVAAWFAEHRGLGRRERRTLADSAFFLLRRLALLRHFATATGGHALATAAPDEGSPASAADGYPLASAAADRNSPAAAMRGGRSRAAAASNGKSLERRLAVLAWQGDAATLDAALADDAEREWLARCRRAATDAALPEALRHNLPEWLAAPLQARLGASFDAWAASIDAPAPLDLRVNVLKTSRDDALGMLRDEGFDATPTPYSPLGLRVHGKPSLHASKALALGFVDVQDEGSQLVALAVGARRGETVVDFCAGAGGKTLALGAQMRSVGRLYAFDVSGQRLGALAPRLATSGLDIVQTAQITGSADERVMRLAGKADRVLVDAPCTGSGTLRRHPDLKWRLAARAVAELAPRQRAILAGAARLVKRGGVLVYATCSVLDAENDAVAADFDRDHGDEFEHVVLGEPLSRAGVGDVGSLLDGNDLRLWTHRHGTDGFFAAAWRRR